MSSSDRAQRKKIMVVGSLDEIAPEMFDRDDVRVIVVDGLSRRGGVYDQGGTGNSWGNSCRSSIEFMRAWVASMPEIVPTEPLKKKTPKQPDATPSVPLRERKKLLKRIRRRR